jgi:hypothetical protein
VKKEAAKASGPVGEIDETTRPKGRAIIKAPKRGENLDPGQERGEF